MSGQLNLTALSATATVSANKFVGDGSELTGVNTGNTAHGTLPSFSAWLNSASTTIAEGQVLPFNATSFNNGDHYDASTTFKFTAPTKGQYTFVFSIGDVQSDNSTERVITFYKNGVAYRDAYTNNVNNLNDAEKDTSVLMDLSTDDTVDVRMRKGSITLDEGDLGAVNKPTFFGYKVGYGDGAMNVDYVYETLPAFRVYFDIAGGRHYGNGETIPFSGIDFNNGDHYNSATSEFTSPSNGYYSFGAQITAGTSSLGNGAVAFYLNDTRYRDIIQFEGSTASHYEQHGVSFAYMSAGDTMKIKAMGTTNSLPVNINYSDNAVGATSFFGYKVGYGDGVSIKTFTKSGSVAFYNDGNVGIGTETPAAKLDVAGDINCTSLGASLVSLLYPIGAIYISSVSTDPSVLLVGTTWERVEGKFLVGISDTDSTFADGAPDIGEKEHTLTVAELPPHTHDYVDYHRGGGAGNEVGIWHNRYDITTNRTTADGSPDLQGLAHNNLPPFLPVYIFKRTA